MPGCGRFGPKEPCGAEGPAVAMTLDEYESVRLIDLLGMTQEQCAAQMDVARTTAQAIYNSARVKLAECLVNQRELKIGGGDYILCENKGEDCPRGYGCGRRRRWEEKNREEQIEEEQKE